MISSIQVLDRCSVEAWPLAAPAALVAAVTPGCALRLPPALQRRALQLHFDTLAAELEAASLRVAQAVPAVAFGPDHAREMVAFIDRMEAEREVFALLVCDSEGLARSVTIARWAAQRLAKPLHEPAAARGAASCALMRRVLDSVAGARRPQHIATPANRSADATGTVARRPLPPRLRLLISAPSGARAAQALTAVTSALAAQHAEPAALQRFADPLTGWHHARCEFESAGAPAAVADLRRGLAPEAEHGGWRLQLGSSQERRRVVVLVGKADHCLLDLFEAWRDGVLEIDIPCVISNHEDLGDLVRAQGVPFHHVPMPPHRKGEAFERVFELFDEYRGDTMVLARFMQIVPKAFCERAAGRILNVHHSLLPAFSGAQPYRQAWEHGVKWIGATCHYATADLDRGPIIEQDTRRVDHAHAVEDLVLAGREVERRVLRAGLRAHVEDRVVVSGARTIVFNQ